MQVTFGQAVGSENLARSTLSSRWPDQPTFVHLTDRERGLTRSSDTDARMDPQDRMPPVASKERFAVAERPSESIISSDRMLLAVPVGALALAATKGCMLKHSATRRPYSRSKRYGLERDQPRFEDTTNFLRSGLTDTSGYRRSWAA